MHQIMQDISIEEQVKSFVAQQTAYRIDKISMSTLLHKDLGVDGDDAVELLENFSEKFQVDLSAFELDRYFRGEVSFDPFVWFAAMLSRTAVCDLEPLTVQDLVNSAKAKRWLKN